MPDIVVTPDLQVIVSGEVLLRPLVARAEDAANSPAVVAVGADLLLGGASKIALAAANLEPIEIVADDLALGVDSLIGQAPGAAAAALVSKGDAEAAAAAAALSAAEIRASRFGSLLFPHSNGLSNNPERVAQIEVPGFNTGIVNMGTASFWDGPSSILVFFDVNAEMQDGQNMFPAFFAMGGKQSLTSARILQMEYVAYMANDGLPRRKIQLNIRGESTASSVWTILSAELPAGRYAALAFNDGTNAYLHALNLDTFVWIDGPAVAKPAGWVGMPQARTPFIIGNIATTTTFPPVVGAAVAPGGAFRGEMRDLLFVNAALSKANVESIANGAAVVATATGAGATKYIHIPMVAAGVPSTAIATTQAGMGAGITIRGKVKPGSSLRKESAASFITMNRLPYPACICMRPNRDTAPLQLSGKTDLAAIDEFRLVATASGRVLVDWTKFRAVVAAGAWSGTAYLPTNVIEEFQIHVRSSAVPNVFAASHSRCLIGPAFDAWAQSEGAMSTFSFNRSIQDVGTPMYPVGDTDKVIFAAWQQPTGFPRFTSLQSQYDRFGLLGPEAMILANRLATELGRPVFIRAQTVSGTSMFDLMNDDDPDRSWADVVNANALMANRGERGETLSCGHIFIGWEAAFSGQGDVLAGMYSPFLTGVGNGVTTTNLAIAQADIDHHLRDGTFNSDAPLVILPCNRVTFGPPTGTFDESPEANQRDWFRNYAHVFGYMVAPETAAHKMQGENAAGGIPNGSVTHAEPGDYEGTFEQAFINAEAYLMAFGRGSYPGPVFFESLRAGSATNKLIARLGDPRPYPGEGLAVGATGYSRAAQRVLRSARKLHTKKIGGDPGAGFEARRKPAGGAWGAWAKANVTTGLIINPLEVELTLAWALAAGDEVEVRYQSGSPGGYAPGVITQAAWRAGLLYFTGEPYDGDPDSYEDLTRLGFAVAGSNQALSFIA